MTSNEDRLAAIEALYRERFQYFLRVAIAIVGDRDRAREAVHDGFANAIRSRTTFRGHGSLESWVWRAVVNAALKAAVPNTEFPDADVAELGRGNGNVSTDRSALREVISRLPERQRLVVFLRYYADLRYEMIAETLNIRTGTVSATLHAAHQSLRRALEEVSR